LGGGKGDNRGTIDNGLRFKNLAMSPMQAIDWILTVLPILLVIACAVYTRRYVKSVADFMAGGRAAGRYVICNAKGQASTGVANTLSKFQPLITAGFCLSWWDSLSMPVYMLVAIFGFVVYRYRQTRAMTLGQFFEMRYSRRFRLFAGILGFLSGILNYGIFPAVSATFFVYFLALPQHVHLFGVAVPTNVLIMAGYLSCALAMMLVGGQITLMVTDCLEGILSHLVWVVVIAAIFCVISWPQLRATLTNAPPGNSMVDPFDQNKTKDYNVWYAMMLLITTVYGTMAVQKDNSFTSAARTPHESRMGVVLGNWRTMARNVMLVVLALGALTFIKLPGFPGRAALQAIADPEIRSQMQVPIALRYMLPVGVKGLFCLIMVLTLMSGDASHMLTWGGIFIQDIVLPLRKTPMKPRQHVLVLRIAVIGVAVFAFLFSVFFHQKQDIVMWWLVTEGVFLCGGGAAIIGGLYWKKGTVAAAWAALITGSGITLGSILIVHAFPSLSKYFDFNGNQARFIAAAASVAVYVVVALLTCREDFDMDRMLHRGRYALKDDLAAPPAPPPQRRRKLNWSSLLGFDADFTLADKIVSGGIFFWSMFWLAVVVVGTIWNLIHRWPADVWATYWLIVGIILPIIVAAVTLVWFGIGGFIDLGLFFRRLSSMKRDQRDDGSVGEYERSQTPDNPASSPANAPISASKSTTIS
jgi:SSS family solute:Na+ symporter